MTRRAYRSCPVSAACCKGRGHRAAVFVLSRHRGLIHAYEFAVDQLAFQSALPICRSSCDTMAGCSYDLALAFPYSTV